VKRDLVDFHALPQRQEAIHADLLNWALYCQGSNSPEVSAMFRDYRPPKGRTYDPPSPKPICDWSKAMRTNRKVTELPQPERLAVQWYYVRRDSPARAKERCETTYEGLAELVIRARDMLIFAPA
jgi:hypothetical protein